MNFSVTFRHMEANENLKDYIKKRLDRMITKYFNEPVEAHVVLSMEKFRYLTEINLTINGVFISGEEEASDIKTSVDSVIERIEHRLRRYKDKIRNRKFLNRDDRIRLKMEVVSQESIEQERPAVVKSKSFYVKPMSVEEAAMQMDLLNNNFLVFKNSATNRINVIYRRKIDVLKELIEVIHKMDNRIDKDLALKVLLEREKLGSTGIGEGIAIPHGKYKGIDRILVSFGRSVEGVDFDAMDGKLTHLFFLLLLPDSASGLHLKILARISKLLKNARVRERILRSNSREEIYRIIVEEDRGY